MSHSILWCWCCLKMHFNNNCGLAHKICPRLHSPCNVQSFILLELWVGLGSRCWNQLRFFWIFSNGRFPTVLMQGLLKIWTEHSHWFLLNQIPLEISQQKFQHFYNLRGNQFSPNLEFLKSFSYIVGDTRRKIKSSNFNFLEVVWDINTNFLPIVNLNK